MPIILQSVSSISSIYTSSQKAALEKMINMFRLRISDDDPDKNILLGKIQAYSDNTVINLLQSAIDDINGEPPRTVYSLFNFQPVVAESTVVNGAIVFSLMKEGLLQLRNQIDYSDSGLSIAMFNKTSMYQSWMGFWMQQYFDGKMKAKAAVLPASADSGFIGIGSEFAYGYWRVR